MSRYSASWASPLGSLHPTLQLHIDALPTPSCALHTQISLPPHFIADKFQLVQLHREGKLGAYESYSGGRDSFVHVGEADLEAPVWRAGEGSVLIRVRGADDEDDEAGPKRIRLEVPLHLRYQAPVKERHLDGSRQDVIEVEFPYPHVFWACPDTSTLHFLPANASTAAVSGCPPPSPAPLTLRAPTGVQADLPFVETTTAATIWLCFAFLAWTAVSTWRRSRREIVDEQKKRQ
ncbi:Protein pbn1 [Rhodotorula toruloides ATCC 204091]|uniref:Protein PBN1 n=1 Tax=Rhodotorula toruloides TaxID=5286 RepID=A0A0K3CFS3_RHOTO|nr:Protein pbn1 [Rhodotorula toruloides ATCC 204091]PRQ73567.1 protein pbn1 [Rhodotorula toruloides]